MENYGIGNQALTNSYHRIQGRILDRSPLAKQWCNRISKYSRHPNGARLVLMKLSMASRGAMKCLFGMGFGGARKAPQW